MGFLSCLIVERHISILNACINVTYHIRDYIYILLEAKLKIVELSFNSNEFGRVLLVIPSMFGKLEVHASEVVWRFEPVTFHIGEMRVKLILATHAFEHWILYVLHRIFTTLVSIDFSN